MEKYGNFNSQQKDILLQFLFFLAGMLSNLIVQVIFLLGSYVYHFSQFTYVLIQACSHLLIVVMPITYMLYCHHNTYHVKKPGMESITDSDASSSGVVERLHTFDSGHFENDDEALRTQHDDQDIHFLGSETDEQKQTTQQTST